MPVAAHHRSPRSPSLAAVVARRRRSPTGRRSTRRSSIRSAPRPRRGRPGNRGIEYATDAGHRGRRGRRRRRWSSRAGGRRRSTSWCATPTGCARATRSCGTVLVHRGDTVARGEPVGTAGDRFHFGARVGDAYVDPALLFGDAGPPRVHLVPDRDEAARAAWAAGASPGGPDAPAARAESRGERSRVALEWVDPQRSSPGFTTPVRNPRSPLGARRPGPPTDGRSIRGCRHHEAAAGGRGPLRPPDPALEPEDEALHLRRAQRHLHHRSPADAGAHRDRVHLRARHSSPTAARSCSSAPRSRPRTRSRATPTSAACRTSTSAGSAACSPTSRRSARRVKKMQEYERMQAAGDFEAMPKKEALIHSAASSRSSSATSAASAPWRSCPTPCSSSTPRRSTSPSPRPTSSACRSSPSSTPTATPTSSSTSSPATTTPSGPAR